MPVPIISARHVAKRYTLGAARERTNSLREAVVASARRAARRLRSARSPQTVEEFWALDDVSFDVARGDVVGVIGRNGAGKSTLLKVLSRITEPTRGRIELRGRVASLLEVGTGFHPELTGRENVYLNGTILGMRKSEIDRKFDAIVQFAEVERFIDTPVKRYSSGMYVRLAFAVAAHLEPEILVIDEVLAVGDAEFQRKCLGKMSDAANEGRTVLFVSHNMAAVRAICTSGLVLRGGRVVAHGPVGEAVAHYTRDVVASTQDATLRFPIGGGRPQFVEIALERTALEYGETLNVRLGLHTPSDVQVAVEVEIHDERGTPVAYASTAPMAGTLIPVAGGQLHDTRLQLGPLPLATGSYALYFWLIKPWAENYHVAQEPLAFEIVHSDPYRVGFEFRQSYGRGAFTVPIAVVEG